MANHKLFAALTEVRCAAEASGTAAGVTEASAGATRDPDLSQPTGTGKELNASATQKENQEEIGTWDGGWEHYKAIPFYTKFGSGKALDFVAWIDHNFVSTLLSRLATMEGRPTGQNAITTRTWNG